jgi:hypothetical protein
MNRVAAKLNLASGLAANALVPKKRILRRRTKKNVGATSLTGAVWRNIHECFVEKKRGDQEPAIFAGYFNFALLAFSV